MTLRYWYPSLWIQFFQNKYVGVFREEGEASYGIFCPFHATVQEKMGAIIFMKQSSKTLGQIHYFEPEIILESVNLNSKVKLVFQDFACTSILQEKVITSVSYYSFVWTSGRDMDKTGLF